MKKITYKTSKEVFVIYANVCDTLEMCAEVQKHAIENNVDLDDIVILNCEMVK